MTSRIQYSYWGLLAATVVVILYAYIFRTSFAPYDVRYYDDLFDHSQYSIAESYRLIGDSDLYPITGLRLLKSSNPYLDVPQAPPLGKYIYAFSILVFQSPFFANYIFLALLLIFSGLFVYRITSSVSSAWLSCMFLVTYPQVVQQLGLTMLDLIQTTFLVGHLYLIDKCKNSARNTWLFLIVAGILLGLYSVTKFGIFTPILVLIDLWYLRKRVRPIEYVCLMVGIAAGYLLPFTPFIIHSDIISFLKNQKWVFLFWLQGNNSAPQYGMPFITLITGMYRHFSSVATWELIHDWSPVMTGMIFLSLNSAWSKLRHMNSLEKLAQLITLVSKPTTGVYILAVILSQLIMLSLIPFYSRYLLPISVLIIIIFSSYQSILLKSKYALLMIITGFALSIHWIQIPPKPFAYSIANQITKGLYLDLCRDIEPTTLPDKDCNSFQRRIHADFHAAGITNTLAQITHIDGGQYSQEISISYNMQHETPAGIISQKSKMMAVRVGNGFKLVWKDGYLLPNYTIGDKIESIFIEGSKGEHTHQGKLVYKDSDVEYFVVHPDQILSEDSVIMYLTQHTDLNDFEIKSKYAVNHTTSLPAMIHQVASRRALNPLPDGVEIVKVRHNAGGEYSAQTGGKIELVKPSGKRHLLLEREMKNGRIMVD